MLTLTLLPSRRFDGNSPIISGGLNHGLVHWWMLLPNDGPRYWRDFVAGNHAYLQNIPTTSIVSGFHPTRKAVTFDRDSFQYTTCERVLNIFPTGGREPLTVCQVLRFKQVSRDVDSCSFNIGDFGGQSGGFQIRYAYSPLDGITSPYAVIFNDVLSVSETSGGNTEPVDTWMMIWGGWESTNNIAKFAVNDRAWVTDGGTLSGPVPGDDVIIAGRLSSGSIGRHFSGTIAETRLFAGILSNQHRAEIYRDMLLGYPRTLRFSQSPIVRSSYQGRDSGGSFGTSIQQRHSMRSGGYRPAPFRPGLAR